MNKPVRIAVTGAAGNIGYAICFRLAAGNLLGPDQPVILHLVEIPPAMAALQGVVMELSDCAFPLLSGLVATDDIEAGFSEVDYAFLVGARPRGPGMERKDLLSANGAIFGPQGKALSERAARDVRVLVVGNPANTNALIAASNAPKLDRRQFHAMTRLDHNRALSQLAAKTGAHVNDIRKMTIWGNHSSTQYPDVAQCTIGGKPAKSLFDDSAASAASSAIDHMRDWTLGSRAGDWISMGVPADGSYGIAPGVVFSYPCVCKGGDYEIVQGLPVDEFSRARLDATDKELREERSAVESLLA